MLRKLFLLLMPLCFASFHAEAVLFKTGEVSQEQFRKVAVDKNQPTYTDWFLNQRNSDVSEAHEQVQDFAHALLKSGGKLTKRQMEDWNNLRSTLALNSADIEILYLLAKKLNVTSELCRYLILLPKLDSAASGAKRCHEGTVALPTSIFAKFNHRDLLVIDGIPFRPDDAPKKMIAGSYQWRIISDEFMDRSFTGTASQFARQEMKPQAWVDGDRDRYELHHDDPGLRSTSEIVFRESKLAPAIPVPVTLSSWASEHKTILWTAGILLTGFAAYSLKDKNLVISNP